MKTYGPYIGKDKRSRCVTVDEQGKMKTVSYPRIVMEAHLGRSLAQGEDIHHKDGNVENNNIENLEVVLHPEHCRSHSTRYVNDVEVECVYCGRVFTLTPKKQIQRASSTNRGTHGPFCSRKCSGKYGTDVQRAAKQECLG